MDRAGFARFLGPHLIDMHRHQVGFCRGWLRQLAGLRGCGVHFGDELLQFRIRRLAGEQVGLARQSGCEFVGKL